MFELRRQLSLQPFSLRILLYVVCHCIGDVPGCLGHQVCAYLRASALRYSVNEDGLEGAGEAYVSCHLAYFIGEKAVGIGVAVPRIVCMLDALHVQEHVPYIPEQWFTYGHVVSEGSEVQGFKAATVKCGFHLRKEQVLLNSYHGESLLFLYLVPIILFLTYISPIYNITLYNYVVKSIHKRDKKIELYSSIIILNGAGDGNRTHVISLEGWSSTIELHPHRYISNN